MGNLEINIGGSFAGMLAVAFIILKLVGTISWKWIWVLSPLWISFVIGIVILIIILLIWWLFG